MGVTFRQRGSFKKTERFLKKAEKGGFFDHLEEYGKLGVEALSYATPVDSGLTASSWSYEIRKTDEEYAIYWTNGNLQDGWFNVAIGIQYGHGTGNGGWIAGKDYINPTIQPVFDEMAEAAWRAVRNA